MTRPSIRPGILLGLGLGGFLDGIVMHQILQWHHLVSAQVTSPDDNALADGIFHAVTWSLTLAGSLAAVGAWRAGRLAPPWRVHVGSMLVGWGLFNLLDSANHFLFGLHHIRDDLGGPASWDAGFLAFAVALLVAGASLALRPASGGPSSPAREGRAPGHGPRP